MLKWVDTLDIAIELYDKHPDIDPQWISFVDLRSLVMSLEDFDDDPDPMFPGLIRTQSTPYSMTLSAILWSK